jgi:hypothetical protein
MASYPPVSTILGCGRRAERRSRTPPLLGPPGGLVLDGREHGGRLTWVGISRRRLAPSLVVDRREISDRELTIPRAIPGNAEPLRDRSGTELGPQLPDLRRVDADGAAFVLASGLRLGDALVLPLQQDLAFRGRHPCRLAQRAGTPGPERPTYHYATSPAGRGKSPGSVPHVPRCVPHRQGFRTCCWRTGIVAGPDSGRHRAHLRRAGFQRRQAREASRVSRLHARGRRADRHQAGPSN